MTTDDLERRNAEEAAFLDARDAQAAQDFATAYGMTLEEAAAALNRARDLDLPADARPLRIDRLADVDLDGQPVPDRLETVVGASVDPAVAPELYTAGDDEDLIDRAVRLAQGDVTDGFQRTNATVLVALDAGGDPLADAAIDAYRSVWREAS